MRNYIKLLRSKFKKYGIDGYIIPKNDDFFTEYSKLNRLEVISNFSGSAGLAIILKNKNYLFTDGRYTIQSKIESGKNFKIYGFDKKTPAPFAEFPAKSHFQDAQIFSIDQ